MHHSNLLLWLFLVALAVSYAAEAIAAPFAYVTNHDSRSVSVIDTATNTVTATVSVGDFPRGVAVNHAGTRVYVAQAGGVSVIDTATNSVVATVQLGFGGVLAFGVAVSPDDSRVYVTSGFLSDKLWVIDAATNALTGTVQTGQGPDGVAVHPAGTRVYVANAGSHTVSVFDTSSNALVATIPLPAALASPVAGLAVNPAGTHIYVTHLFFGLFVIDTATNAQTTTILAPGAIGGVAFHPAGTTIYLTRGGDLALADTATNTLVGNILVGAAPKGVSVNPAGTRVYVANSGGTVSVVDTSTNAVIATIPVGDGPFALAITPGDGPPPPPTSLEGFVARFYGSVLGRQPESAEHAGWVAFLRGGCNATGFDQIARGFFGSLEFRNERRLSLTEFVATLYRTFLGREPDLGGLLGWAEVFRQQRLAAANGFIRSVEFGALLRDRTNREAVSAVVTRLYQQILSREPEPAGLTGWVEYVVASGDLEGTAAGFLVSPEFEARPLALKDYVTILYRTFLGREPDAAGLEGWVENLDAHLLGIINGGFVPSPEFQDLVPQVCGQ